MRTRSRRVALRTFMQALLIGGVATSPAFAQATPEGRVQAPAPSSRQ